MQKLKMIFLKIFWDFHNIFKMIPILVLAGGLLFVSQTCVAGEVIGLSQITDGGLFSDRYVKEAFEIFERAGYSSYFEDLAWLWTEPEKTRSALQLGIATVSPEQACQMQTVLIKALQINPEQTDALILAGKVHYYQNQKAIALWYFERAAALRPDYEPALLSLADYYLSEGCPEQALQVVKTIATPRAFFRKGVAAIQQSQYHLALGYLLQADLYSGELAAVRNKDLAKVLRNFGDLTRARALLDKNVPARRVGQILYQEIRISCAILGRNTQLALKSVESGRFDYPEYPFWDFYQCLSAPRDESAPIEILEPEYRAAVYLLQGQEYVKENRLNEAYQSFLKTLKADRNSLLGYYEAGIVQMKRKKMDAAIKLFSKGLEMGPDFVPLLTKRAAANEQLGRIIEAEGDRASARRVMAEFQTPPQVVISRSETDETWVYLRQKPAKTIGFWFSTDGNTWAFSLWDRMTVSRNAVAVWIIPAGKSVPGIVYRINLKKSAVKWEPPMVSDNALEFRLPYSSRVVVDQLSSYHVNGWMTETAGSFSRMLLNRFGDGLQTFRIWYGLDDGTWMSGLYRINRVSPKKGSGVNFTVTTDKIVTNQQMIRLKITTFGQPTDKVRMAVGEAQETSGWMPFQDNYLYRVSSGDGMKSINVRFSDDAGRVTETRLYIELDTTMPQIKDFNLHDQRLSGYPVSWTVSEPVTTRLRVFSDQGNWNEVTVSCDSNQYSAMVPRNGRLCQVLLTDRAGNTAVYTDDQLSQRLQSENMVKFEVAGGIVTHSRNVQIKPLENVLRWALSNDLQSWSGWHKGAELANWRIEASTGWQIIYIKYQWMGEDGENHKNYEAVRVYYN